MINEQKALSMQEVNELLKSVKENNKGEDIKAFIKKYNKTAADKAKKLKEELEGLELLKLKQNDIVKIVDLTPQDAAELNKIFTEVTLDEDETNKILETIKNNK